MPYKGLIIIGISGGRVLLAGGAFIGIQGIENGRRKQSSK